MILKKNQLNQTDKILRSLPIVMTLTLLSYNPLALSTREIRSFNTFNPYDEHYNRVSPDPTYGIF